MTDATIAALLEELREVDPETMTAINFYSKGLQGFDIDTNPNKLVKEDIIQGCIQRATTARPDHWIISQWMSQDKWRATIRRGPRGYTDPEYMHIGEGDTPAAAILAAYIGAKRASR
jgi:hypothetical protein